MKGVLVVLAVTLAGCGGGAPAPRTTAPVEPVPAPSAVPRDSKQAACSAAPEALHRVVVADAVASALEGTRGTVKEVRVEADGPQLSERARAAVMLKAGSALSDEAVRADVGRLWELGELEDVIVESSGSPEALVVTYRVKRAPRVRAAFWEGDGASEAIAKQMGVAKGLRLQEETLTEGIAHVEQHLRELGHRHAKAYVSGVRREDGSVDACVHVNRGPRLLLGEVSLSGNVAISTDELLTLMTVKPGEPLSDDFLERDVLVLQGTYYDRGYVTATVQPPEISEQNGALQVRIVIKEGPQFKVGKIGVAGDLVTTKAAYAKRITVRPGEVFNRRKLLEDITRLQELHAAQKATHVQIATETTLDVAKRRINLVLRVIAQ